MKINAGQAPSTLVPKYIGSDYDKVKSVAENIEYVKEVAEGLKGFAVASFCQATAPTLDDGVANGSEWFCTTNGRTYVWYVDADSAQWVESSPQGTVEEDVLVGIIATEALKRSYAEAGYALIGNFTDGCTVTTPKQVILFKPTGDCYEWTGVIGTGHAVAPGTDPTVVGSGYVPRTDAVLRTQLSSNNGALLVGGLPFVSPLHFGATPGASVDATAAIKSAISKSVLTGWPLDLRGGPWLFSQTLDFTGVRRVVSDYSGRLICNPVGFSAASADVGAWAVTFGLPIGGAFANRNDAVVIDGTLWVESLNRDAALDGVYLKGAWINAGHIRAVKFKGWGIYRDSVWDSTFDRCSVELCGTTSKHAYWHSSNGDTANASHTNSVQCEQAYHKAIYINAIRDVIDNIHAERTFQLTANDGSSNADGSTWLNSFVLLGNSTLNQLVMDSATVNPTTGETIVVGQLYKAQFGLDGSTVISAKIHGDVLQVFGGGEYINLACEKYYQKSPSSGVVINSPLITTAQVESGVTFNGGSVTNARFNFNARNIRYNSVTVADVATSANLQGDIKFNLCKITTVGDTRYSASGYSPVEFYGCEIVTFTGAYDASAWVYGGYINSCPLASQSRARFFDVEFGTFAPTGNSGYLTKGCWAATVSSWTYPLHVNYPAGIVTERIGYNAGGKIYQNTDGALTWAKIA